MYNKQKCSSKSHTFDSRLELLYGHLSTIPVVAGVYIESGLLKLKMCSLYDNNQRKNGMKVAFKSHAVVQ